MEPSWERAIVDGKVDRVRAMIRAKADVNARDRHGQTALMLAAHRGHREIVELLIEAGADLDVTAKYNLSALMLSIVAGHVAIARLLVRAGADLGLTGSGAPGFSGKTAHDLAVARGLDELGAELEAEPPR